MFEKRLIKSFTLALAAAVLAPAAALASSHREAPLLTEDPTVDATDLYAFRNGANVVLVANYIPFENAAGGPNFYRFSDNAVYRINVDNTGDAVPDIVFEFRFRTTIRDPNTFLYNTGPIVTGMMNGLNVRQTMTVTRTRGTMAPETLAADVEVAPAYVGRHSFTMPTVMPMGSSVAGDTAYDAYVVANNIRPLTGGGQVFAGPRDDPFFVDLGATFDLLRIRPGPPGNAGGGIDTLAGYNTHSIVVEVPITSLTAGGAMPTDPAMASSIIGVWTTAHRPRVRVLRGTTNNDHHGQLVQVSRLGNPLINEVLVPLAFKDFFLGSLPQNDVANYAGAIMNNEVTRLLNALYGTGADVAMVGGALVQILRLFNMAITPADILHLNLAAAANPFPMPGSAATLGALAMDGAGYPNGRRLADDVVDIDLRVLAGTLSGRNVAPNNALGDGVNQNDRPFAATFPYLARPHEGYAGGNTGRLEPPAPPR